MSAPRWARWLLARLAPPEREEEVVGDLEEAHRLRVGRGGRLRALAWTTFETLDVAWTLVRARVSSSGTLFSWLDVKLGARMLVRHPGLAILGGLSMAFAIFIGAGTFELVSKALNPTIPLPEGDRIVTLRLWDASRTSVERRALYDVRVWRDELRSVEDLTVYRNQERNLVTGDGMGTPVVVAEMSASGFELAAVPPELGRALTSEDERPGAAPVVVIGHGVWVDRFAADPEIVGTDIRLGGTPTTVVGVMPEGFGFPVAHDMWMPFVTGGGAYEPREGPRVSVLARRVDDASMNDARTELAVLGRRMAQAFPATHEHLQPQVVPLARAALGLPHDVSTAMLAAVGVTSNLPLILFLILVCGNVALLMFARATAREGELVIRSALGASRGRIVAQLFAEALVLAAAAAALGLLATGYGLRWALWIIRLEIFGGDALPFWLDASVSLQTIGYVGLLTVLAALVAGAWPGLRVTRALGEGLKRGTAGGGGFRFGGVWTAVIAGQIVIMMLFPMVTLAVRAEGQVELDYDPPFRMEEYVVARAEADEGETRSGSADEGETRSGFADEGGTPSGPAAATDPTSASAGSARSTGGALALLVEERLLAEPGVTGVALAERLPMTYHPWHQVEIDGPSAEPRDARGHRVGSARVTIDFFDVLDAEIVAGRGFDSGDLEEGANAVVVDDAFVDRVLGGRHAVGVHIRYLANESYRDPSQEAGPWLEIVGVVEEIGARCFYGPGGIYHPTRPEALSAAHIIARVPGGAEEFGPRVRAIGASVDPTLRLHGVQSLVEATREPRDFYAFWTSILVAVSGFALLLSMGGIYAVMSYTVARRTREIGIRVALGSSRLGVVRSVFRRPLGQVVLGLGTGFLLFALLLVGLSDGGSAGEVLRYLGWLVGYTVLTAGVCLIACAAPTRRALKVEPQEALRVEG